LAQNRTQKGKNDLAPIQITVATAAAFCFLVEVEPFLWRLAGSIQESDRAQA
jgi:hypothetical protein